MRALVEVQRLDYSIGGTTSSHVRPKTLAVDVTGYDMKEVVKAVRDAKALMGGWSHAVQSHYLDGPCFKGPGSTCHAITL